MTRKKKKKILFWSLAVFFAGLTLFALFLVLPFSPDKNPSAKLGVTYSIHAAEALGLDWREAYEQTVTELSPDILRIPVYWDILETERDTYNWQPFDAQLELLEGTDTDVMLVVGHKLPRWPECHLPDWTESLGITEIEEELEQVVTDVVKRYRNHPNLHAWQVQNEALFPFGECPEWSRDRSRLKRLITLTRNLDPQHDVTTSDSGELSTWIRTSTLPIDALDISLYRAVYGSKFYRSLYGEDAYFFWPVNPYFYKIHAALVRPFVEDIIISELQMEPWGPKPVYEMSAHEAFRSFSPYHFAERIDFAQRTGADIILAWGVEYWYYMKEERGFDGYWQQALNHF